MEKRLPKIFYNPISLTGAVIAVFNAAFAVFLAIAEAFAKHHRPYADLVIFLVLPMLVLFGIVLIIIGIRRERRKEQSGTGVDSRFLIIDFNNTKHRKTAIMVLSGFLLLSLLYAFAGYKTYEFTESDTFCGVVCHRVHKLENQAHIYSVHAEISCSDCHVGPGVKYFVLYKLKGTRQLFDLITNRYPRPIPAPVVDLRPSQDVCENCHGPKYQINQRLESRTYFLSDKHNTRKTINLLLRMGNVVIRTHRSPRMHWHYSTTEEIVYATSDPKRMVIPWIRVKRLDGKERVYRSTEVTMSDADAAKATVRQMDCIDCHNRLGHSYNPPDVTLNALLALKLVNPDLPEIKRVGVKALDEQYTSREDALKGIDESIRSFYKTKYPDLSSSKAADIDSAIRTLQGAYDRNFDPYMKVSWRNFPNNQGHRFSPGCFRCHDGKHRSDDGAVLSRDCSLCHLLIERAATVGGTGSYERAVFQVMRYPHPVDIGDAWKEMFCHECHASTS